jgi:DNA-binding transcriptional LysR family regulator
MGTEPGTPTFDQLRVLLAVVDAKTLAGAARRLGRATSAVSYAIAQLESQLGIALFDRQTTRRLQLTQAGQAVMAEACVVAGAMDALRAKVKGLLDGLEAEVSVVVDVMYPTARLVQALRAFQQHYPTVGIRLHVEALGAVTQKVLEGGASFGISGPLRSAGGRTRPSAHRRRHRRGRARPYPACADRSLAADGRPGFRRPQREDLAAG